MRITITFAALLMAVSAEASSGGTPTPFDLLDDGSLVVPVTIGGTGPYRFVIDTGSSRTVITARLWQSLRRPVVAQTVMVTPAGRHLAYVVKLDDLTVGPLPAMNIEAAVVTADRYAGGQPIDGLIGQDVLASAIYTIDYRQRVIVWHGPDDQLPGKRLALDVRDRRVLVVLPQRDGDRKPLFLIPDSGSDALVLFDHARDKLRMTLQDVDILTSLSGVRLARRAQVDKVIVGDACLQQSPAVIVDSGESAGAMGDGLLPLHVFSRVTFNVRERYLIVETR